MEFASKARSATTRRRPLSRKRVRTSLGAPQSPSKEACSASDMAARCISASSSTGTVVVQESGNSAKRNPFAATGQSKRRRRPTESSAATYGAPTPPSNMVVPGETQAQATCAKRPSSAAPSRPAASRPGAPFSGSRRRWYNSASARTATKASGTGSTPCVASNWQTLASVVAWNLTAVSSVSCRLKSQLTAFPAALPSNSSHGCSDANRRMAASPIGFASTPGRPTTSSACSRPEA
mmetsp:Transcript_2887/g.8574  ORF Transcript_2887/g.8574 Transcript_2887/m.8574 type:complete len:237 (+) Transcript_2887:117-827(+)